MKKLLKANKYDYIIFFSLILAAAALAGTLAFVGGAESGQRAEIHIGGRLYKSVSLREEKRFEIPGMQIEVSRGRIGVIESDCPKKICRHIGWISSPGRSIVCVPNETVVSISGESKEYDAITY